MGAPVVGADRTVVGAAQQGQFLVKTRLIVPTRYAKGDALGRHEVIQFTQRAAVLEHFEEWIGEICVELVSVDGLAGWGSRGVEQENAVQGDVSSRNKGPPDGATLLGEVVDEHADVAVIGDAIVGEALRNGDVLPRRLVPNIVCAANEKARKEFTFKLSLNACFLEFGPGRKRKKREQQQGHESDAARLRGHGQGTVAADLAVSPWGWLRRRRGKAMNSAFFINLRGR